MEITRRAFGALVAGSGVMLAGCGDAGTPPPRLYGSGAPRPRRGGTLHLAKFVDVATLDPAQWQEWTVGPALFDRLLEYSPATAAEPMALVPGLCERWSVDPGGTVYTFNIRPGVRFSNGEPLVADDFVYALNRVLDPEVASSGAQFYEGIVGARERLAGKAAAAEGARATDERTLVIRLEAPDPAFPYLAALPFLTPLKRRHVEEVGPRIREQPLGTGPFLLREWREGARFILERNPFYRDPERPFLDRIQLDINVPRSVAALKFLRGEIDIVDTFASLAADDLLRFMTAPAWRPYIEESPSIEIFHLILNTERPPFTDRRARQAINYAVNKGEILRLMNGLGVAANGMVPPLIRGHCADRAPYPFDPDRARRLLADAGYPDGFDIECLCFNDDTQPKIVQSVQADLARVGVRLHLRSLSTAPMHALLNRREFDLWYTSWVVDFPDPWDFLLLFHSRMIANENGLNRGRYSNPAVDRLLDDARREMDTGARLALYRRAEDILYEDSPFVALFFPIQVQIRQPYLMGCGMHPGQPEALHGAWLDDPRRPTL